MCKRCEESWTKFKAIEKRCHKARQEYLKQCRENCDDKEFIPEKKEPKKEKPEKEKRKYF